MVYFFKLLCLHQAFDCSSEYLTFIVSSVAGTEYMQSLRATYYCKQECPSEAKRRNDVNMETETPEFCVFISYFCIDQYIRVSLLQYADPDKDGTDTEKTSIHLVAYHNSNVAN